MRCERTALRLGRYQEGKIHVCGGLLVAKPGKEVQFSRCQRRGTRQIVEIYGGLGSRLHQERDGRFVAMAEWPDETTGSALSMRAWCIPVKAAALFVDAIAERRLTTNRRSMTVTDDLLVRSGEAPGRRPILSKDVYQGLSFAARCRCPAHEEKATQTPAAQDQSGRRPDAGAGAPGRLASRGSARRIRPI